MSAAYSLPLNTQAEEALHAPLDYAERSSRRKTVLLLLFAVAHVVMLAVMVKMFLQPKEVFIAVKMPNGDTYIISSPQKQLDVRNDVLGYQAVKMSLTSFAEAYFERSAVTAQKDWEHARWFLPDNLLAAYDEAALGDKGWIKGLQTHTISESHARIDTIEIRDADLEKEPYQARVYLARTNLGSGEVLRTIATLTFVVRPGVWMDKDKNGGQKFTRFPLYNALGVIVVKPIEETTLDSRK